MWLQEKLSNNLPFIHLLSNNMQAYNFEPTNIETINYYLFTPDKDIHPEIKITPVYPCVNGYFTSSGAPATCRCKELGRDSCLKMKPEYEMLIDAINNLHPEMNINGRIQKYLNEILNLKFFTLIEYFANEFENKNYIKFYVEKQVMNAMQSINFIQAFVTQTVPLNNIFQIYTSLEKHSIVDFIINIMNECISQQKFEYLREQIALIPIPEDNINNIIYNVLLKKFKVDNLLNLFTVCFGKERIRNIVLNKFYELLTYGKSILKLDNLPASLPTLQIGNEYLPRCLRLNNPISYEYVKNCFQQPNNNIHFVDNDVEKFLKNIIVNKDYNMIAFCMPRLFRNKNDLILGHEEDHKYMNAAIEKIYSSPLF